MFDVLIWWVIAMFVLAFLAIVALAPWVLVYLVPAVAWIMWSGRHANRGRR